MYRNMLVFTFIHAEYMYDTGTVIKCHKYTEETPTRRIKVRSSLNEIYTDQLGKRMVHGEEKGVSRPHPFSTAVAVFMDPFMGELKPA
jgi:hypothetical protein